MSDFIRWALLLYDEIQFFFITTMEHWNIAIQKAFVLQ